MNQISAASAPAQATGATPSTIAGAAGSRLRAALFYPLLIGLAAVTITLSIEVILRGSFTGALSFLADPQRPAAATVALIALALIAIDAVMARAGQSVLVVAPVLLALAWIGREKLFYLGDPPYPTDFLYARQIAELMPLMMAERPVAGALTLLSIAGAIVLLVVLWRKSGRMPKVTLAGRAARLAIALPVVGFFALHMDYSNHSPLRSSVNIAPKMWDQKANYAHNGLVMAFAMNVPMANVAAPSGYSADAIARAAPEPAPAFVPARRPDIIMVMSESMWDPTRLPRTTMSPDPLGFTRSIESGHVFSPEFGGMTANVEFEALTGFSNAMLPYGSIPYQQYVRGDMPSLASFLRQEGYSTLAIHPFQGWFWNRTNVYDAFGFERFLSEDTLGKMDKRGRLASDAALTDLIISEAEAAEEPLFLFAVSLQNHGPYEPDRYPDQRIEVKTKAGEPARAAIQTFAEGMMDSDKAFERLVEWAKKRERETIVVYFGDHLPPLGETWVSTGFMERTVSNRFGTPQKLTRERETPLVVWSNRSGPVEDIGTVSPAFLPLHTLRAARMEHPFYTGFLGELHEKWRVVDRHMLVDEAGHPTTGWSRRPSADALLRDYRLIQYDIMFGSRHGQPRLFPDEPAGYPSVNQPGQPLHNPV